MSYSAPGVYINYVTDGPLVVRAASTSTAVFVGPTVIGKNIDAGVVTPTKVSSLTEYADIYSTKGCRAGVVSLPTAANDFVDVMGHALRGFFLNGGKNAYIVSMSTDTEVVASTIFQITGSAGAGGAQKFRASAASAGKWGNAVTITAKTSSLGQDYCDIQIDLVVNATGGATTATELYVGQKIGDVANIASNIVTIEEVGSGTAAFTLDVSAASPPDATESGSLTTGKNSMATLSTDMGAVFDALKDIDDISLIGLPGRVWPTNQADYETAIAHAQAMKDRMVHIQLEDATTDFGAVSVPHDKYAAVYYPEATVTVQTPGGGELTQGTGITGHVAGVFARTDSQKGPWTAPAGMHASVAGVTKLTKDISQTKQESINPENINALRYIEGVPVVWGARTRDKGGIYEYVPVMRTAFLIADSLRETLNRVVFAKNTEVLWKNVKAGVTGFMDGLYTQGAFQGATPSQAFEVAVGLGESMTQTDIDTGLLRVTVRFRPAKVAEFIEISMEQLFETAA